MLLNSTESTNDNINLALAKNLYGEYFNIGLTNTFIKYVRNTEIVLFYFLTNRCFFLNFVSK